MKRWIVFLLMAVTAHAADAPFGDIPASLSLSTSQAVRRNAANTAFEAFTPGTGSGSVTSIGLLGTTNQITITGASPIATSGTWTVSIPNAAQLNVAKLTNLTTNGPIIASAGDGTLNVATLGTGLSYSDGTGTIFLDLDLQAISLLTGTNTIYYRSAANTWSPVTIGGNLTFSGGTLNAVSAPADISGASYITKVAESGLSNEFALGSLATGLLKNTTSTGVPTIAVAKTDYWDTTDMVASGASHAHGLVPDPGSSAGTTKFLREDGSWNVPPGSGTATAAGGAGDVQYNNGSNALAASANFDYGTANANALTLTSQTTSNTMDDVEVLYHDITSTTPNVGLGASIRINADDTTTNNIQQARIGSVWTDATHNLTTSTVLVQAGYQGNFWTVARFSGIGSLHVGGNITTDPTLGGVVNADSGYQANGVATSGTFLQGQGTVFNGSAYKLPTSVGTAGYNLVSNGTDMVAQAPDGSVASTTASTTSWTPDFDANSMAVQTALAGALTVNAPTWTGTRNGVRRIIRLKDNGTARAITWTTGSTGAFRASTDLALPTTTTANKTIYCRFYWNNDDSRWDFMAKLDNF
jgi:hypothetical protein